VFHGRISVLYNLLQQVYKSIFFIILTVYLTENLAPDLNESFDGVQLLRTYILHCTYI